MATHISFPEIGQFRNAIRNVTDHSRYVGKDAQGEPIYDPTKAIPTLRFEGTVKLHGTNAAIVHSSTETWFQSREHVLTLEQDNAGFMRNYYDKDLSVVFSTLSGSTIAIYGEWCGGSVQKTVALAQLPKMFVVFAVKLDGVWQGRDIVSKVKDPSLKVYNIYDYASWIVDIDFNFPQLKQNELGEITQAVEKECPVAKALGAIGTGEGVVWKCITPGWEDDRFWFKVKGKAHSASHVKELASVDIEKVQNQKDFIAKVVTESRCSQSIDKLKEKNLPLTRASLGEYIRWIIGDVVKEESDLAKASGIEIEKIGGGIANAAKQWFFANELKF